MEVTPETNFRNAVWRRLSRGWKTENVVHRVRNFKNTLVELFSCVKPSSERTAGDIDITAECAGNKIENNFTPAFLLARENRGEEIGIGEEKGKKIKDGKYCGNSEMLAQLEKLETRFYEQQEILNRHRKPDGPRYVPTLTDEKVRELNAMACDLWRRQRKEDHSKCKLDWDWVQGKRDCHK